MITADQTASWAREVADLRAVIAEQRRQLDTMLRLNDEQNVLYQTALGERDEARRMLIALQSTLRPALSPMAAARLEADLGVYALEEQILTAVETHQPIPALLVEQYKAARARVAELGGGS